MSLVELVDNTKTDKNTVHSYLPLYERLLSAKKDSARNVLEVGICHGGSIKLWSDYFPNAKTYGVDVWNDNQMWKEIKNKPNIQLYTSTDGYNPVFVKSAFIDKDIKFDMALDDGPHTLESMINFIKLYLPLMADDGILIIEDVQQYSWTEKLSDTVPEDMKKYIEIFDLRDVKGRYDDIVFVVNKSLLV